MLRRLQHPRQRGRPLLTSQPSLFTDGDYPRPAHRATFALRGPGWAVPDQGLSPFPLPHWDLSIRAAANALTEGADDRLALWHFDHAPDTLKDRNEALAALDFNDYRTKLRRSLRRRSP